MKNRFYLYSSLPAVLIMLASSFAVHAQAGKLLSGSIPLRREIASMFDQSKLEIAVARYQPLILCRIVSSVESAKETRSHKTEYSIQVQESTVGFESQRKTIWTYGGASLEAGVHLMILDIGGRIDSSIFIPDGKEKLGLESFNEAKSRMAAIKAKFLPLEAFRKAIEGKADLIMAKVKSRSPIESGKGSQYSLEVLETLAGKETAEVQAQMDGAEPLIPSASYFISLDRKKKTPMIIAAIKVSPEEMKSLSSLYHWRLGILKEPWSKKYAEP